MVLLAEADWEYVLAVEKTKAHATATVAFRPVTLQYHGELAISRLGEDAFNAVMKFLKKLEAGDIAGYEGGPANGGHLKGVGAAKQYSYRQLGTFPEKFLCQHLGSAASDSALEQDRWLKNAVELVGPWCTKDPNK